MSIGDYATMSLSGRLTKDAQIFTINDKTRKAVFSVAINRSFKLKDGTYNKKTTYVDCVVWGSGLVNHVEKYAKKGVKVSLVGAWEDDNWEKDGQKQRRSQLNVENINIFNTKEEVVNAAASDDSPVY